MNGANRYLRPEQEHYIHTHSHILVNIVVFSFSCLTGLNFESLLMKMSPNYKNLDIKIKILNLNCLNFAMFFEIDGVSMCLPFDFDTPAPLRVGRDKKYRPATMEC